MTTDRQPRWDTVRHTFLTCSSWKMVKIYRSVISGVVVVSYIRINLFGTSSRFPQISMQAMLIDQPLNHVSAWISATWRNNPRSESRVPRKSNGHHFPILDIANLSVPRAHQALPPWSLPCDLTSTTQMSAPVGFWWDLWQVYRGKWW